LATQIKLPDNIILNSEVEEFPLKGKATKPQREVWYARVQFADSRPAADFEHGVSTRVTFWEKGVEEGILLGQASYKGWFHAAFSDKETADLKAGKAWLTLTVGNWLTKAKRDDPRLKWSSLSTDQEKVRPATVQEPRLYYGRLLFEDGAPVSSAAWSGREVRVDFPYAGSATVEGDGYFKVCFTGDQYEKAKAEKERKNIYIPSSEERNRSSARFVFPVSKLSRDKEQSGVVKIPKPEPEK